MDLSKLSQTIILNDDKKIEPANYLISFVVVFKEQFKIDNVVIQVRGYIGDSKDVRDIEKKIKGMLSKAAKEKEIKVEFDYLRIINFQRMPA